MTYKVSGAILNLSTERGQMGEYSGGKHIILDWLCILIMYCKIPENLLMQNDVSSFDN